MNMQEYASSKDVRDIFGLKRSTLLNLSSSGKIKSLVLRREGAKRGIRLFYLPSVRDFLDAQLIAQNQ